MTEATGEKQPWEQTAAFSPTPPKPERQPRQRRTQRAAPAEKPPEAPKKERKKREPRAAKPEKAERAAPETIKVTLKEFATMRVGEDNAKAFIKAHGLLSELSKGARTKVLAELQKVFG